MTQPEIQWAEAARDDALELVAANAGQRWQAAAIAWLESFLRAHPEYVPDRDNLRGPQPVSRRAWGVVTRHALRAGWVERTGYAPRACGHCTPGPVYRSRIFGEG